MSEHQYFVKQYYKIIKDSAYDLPSSDLEYETPVSLNGAVSLSTY